MSLSQNDAAATSSCPAIPLRRHAENVNVYEVCEWTILVLQSSAKYAMIITVNFKETSLIMLSIVIFDALP